MEIEVFDDLFSLGHLIFGVLTVIFPIFFLLFFVYELLEFIYKYPRKREGVRDFIGDLFEFLVGVAFAELFLAYSGVL